ncbi:MAG: hypothetical protein ACTSU2_14670 [Promethearchaeota archaeon]
MAFSIKIKPSRKEKILNVLKMTGKILAFIFLASFNFIFNSKKNITDIVEFLNIKWAKNNKLNEYNHSRQMVSVKA